MEDGKNGYTIFFESSLRIASYAGERTGLYPTWWLSHKASEEPYSTVVSPKV